LPERVDQGTTTSPPLKSILNADARYGVKRDAMGDFQNPDPDLTLNPNKPLQRAVAIIQSECYMHWRVTSLPQPNGKGVVVDIPFEERVSDVTAYFADYWMLFKGEARYLAYTQTILMKMTIAAADKNNDDVQYVFPHITCNTVAHTC